jgi:hypothetical protein
MISAHAATHEDFATDPATAHRDRLARLGRIAGVMDSALVIPGTGIRLGADALVGLLPGVGDLATKAVAAYIVVEARRMGVPRRKIARMVANLGVDLFFGTAPVLGDVFDVFWRANNRNMRIVYDHFGTPEAERLVRP